jgi:hypothetical protein
MKTIGVEETAKGIGRTLIEGAKFFFPRSVRQLKSSRC